MCLGVVAQLDECPAKYFRIHFSDPSTVIGLICVCVWFVFSAKKTFEINDL